MTLKYQLNFVGADGKAVTSIDPDIRNGGTTKSFDQTAYLLAGAGLVLLVAIVMTIRFSRRRGDLNPGGRP